MPAPDHALQPAGIWRWLLPLLSGFLLFASFAPLEWGGMAWVALVPLVMAVRGAGPKQAFRSGFLAGSVFWLASLAWLIHVSAAGWILLALYCALYLGLFAVLCARWLTTFGVLRFRHNLGFMLLAALGWAGLEYVRSVFGTGFAWNPLAASQTRNLAVLQITALGGASLLSALVVWVNAGTALTIMRYVELKGFWGRRPHPEMIAALLLVALSFFYGVKVIKAPPPLGGTLRVALIQPAIPQDEKWDEQKVMLIYSRLVELTTQAQAMAPDLVVWPETALPDELRNSDPSYELVYHLATNGVPILVGTMDTLWPEEGRPVFYNCSILVDGDGYLVEQYNKQHLVVFGEYVPFRDALPIMKAMTPIQESFTGGTTATVFRLQGGGPAAFSALICFEDTVAALSRAFVKNGARMLVNQTNDAWFDPSWASRQHLAHSILRAVENRVPVVRSANSGATAHIDHRGHVVSLLENEAGQLAFPGFRISEVKLPADGMPLTFYTRYGDFFGMTAAGFTLLLLATSCWPRRRVA